MKDRLQELIIDKRLTSARLAEAVGVQPSAISHILSGRNKPGFDFLANLLREYSDINPKWLILGEGEMYAKDAMGAVQAPTPRPEIPIDQNASQEGDTNKSLVTNVTGTKGVAGTPNAIELVIVFYNDGSFKEYSNK